MCIAFTALTAVLLGPTLSLLAKTLCALRLAGVYG